MNDWADYQADKQLGRKAKQESKPAIEKPAEPIKVEEISASDSLIMRIFKRKPKGYDT